MKIYTWVSVGQEKSKRVESSRFQSSCVAISVAAQFRRIKSSWLVNLERCNPTNPHAALA